MTTLTHFSIFKSGGNRYFRGRLFPVSDSPLETIYLLINAGVDLELLTHQQARSLWRLLWNPPYPIEPIDAALARIEYIFTAAAAPGYEFTAWFIDGARFWGWFPRTG